MPSVSWPSSLPYKALAGTHSFQREPNIVAFKPDAGEPMRRRRYQGKATTDSFDMILTSAQKDALMTFYDDTLSQGAMSFIAPLIDGVSRTWWFDPASPPAATNVRGGTAYKVSFRMGCRR